MDGLAVVDITDLLLADTSSSPGVVDITWEYLLLAETDRLLLLLLLAVVVVVAVVVCC